MEMRRGGWQPLLRVWRDERPFICISISVGLVHVVDNIVGGETDADEQDSNYEEHVGLAEVWPERILLIYENIHLRENNL